MYSIFVALCHSSVSAPPQLTVLPPQSYYPRVPHLIIGHLRVVSGDLPRVVGPNVLKLLAHFPANGVPAPALRHIHSATPDTSVQACMGVFSRILEEPLNLEGGQIDYLLAGSSPHPPVRRVQSATMQTSAPPARTRKRERLKS